MSVITTFLRHPFTRRRFNIGTVQELLGHRDVSTTMIYAHVLNRGGRGVNSPADSTIIYDRSSAGRKKPPIVREITRRPGPLLSGEFNVDKLG